MHKKLLDDSACADWMRELRVDLRRHGACGDAIEDVVQDTWLRTLKSPPRTGEDLRGWLHVVAKRLLWKRSTAERRRLERERFSARPERLAPEEERSAEEDSALIAAVRGLPEKVRPAIELRFLEGLPLTVVAERLGLTVGGVSHRLKVGLELLRGRLEGKQDRRMRALAPLAWWLRRLGPEARPRFVLWAVALASVVLFVFLGRVLLETPSAARGTGTREPEVAVQDATPLAPLPVAREARPLGGAAAAAPGPVSRRGIVRDPLGNPVAGANLVAGSMLGAGAGADAVVARSDAGGRFELGHLEPEKVLWATHPDWAGSWRCYVDSLAPGADCELVLQPGVTRRFRAEDARGAPLAGATIALGPIVRERALLASGGGAQYPGGRLVARTDARGEAELLVPADCPLEYELTSAAQACGRGTLPALDRQAAPTATPEVLRLPQPFGVEGRVRDAEGLAVRGARVEVLQEGRPALVTHADGAGAFRIEGLVAGAYELRASGDALDARTDSYAESGSVVAGAWLQREFELSPAFTFAGRVAGPLAPRGARVEAVALTANRGLRFPHAVALEPDGTFVLPGCLAMVHGLDLVLPDGSSARLEENEEARLVPGGGAREFRFELPRATGAVRVHFAGGDRGGESGALPTFVELRNNRRDRTLIRPVEVGPRAARFELVPGGEYCVFAWIPGYGAWNTEVTLGPNSPEELELRVPPTGRLVVEVIPPPGVDPQGMSVRALLNGLNANGFEHRGTRALQSELRQTGPLRFEGEFLAGDHRIVLRCPGRFGAEACVEVPAHGALRHVFEPRRSRELHLALRASPPLEGREKVTGVAVTASGEELELGAIPRLEEGEPVFVPEDSVQLLLRSTLGRCGSLELDPAESAAESRRSFVVQLEHPPTPSVASQGSPSEE